MPAVKNRNRAIIWCLGLFLVAASGYAVAGMQAQGMQAQGMQAQGMQAQGMQAQGMQAQGMQAQGMQAQGMQAQGMQAQGMQAQGMQAQGMQAQGMQAQGVAILGNDVSFAEYKGVEISSVELRGNTAMSDIVSHELTSVPGVSTGAGNYITVGAGESVVGHYAVAHLIDGTGAPAEDIDLYIAGEQRDPIPNLFHNADEQDNQDQLYVVYFFQKWSGEWLSLCPYNPLTQSASAMPIPEDPANPNKFIFACTATGVASKCARNWGYRPWAKTQAWFFDDNINDWVLKTQDLKPYYDVCKVAARAAYCQDEKSFTKNGTLVDLFDTRQIIWPNAVENPLNKSNPDSLWMMAQEYFISFDPSPFSATMQSSALQRTRYRELSPSSDCSDFAFIDRLEHDNVEDGRWASPLTNTPRLQIFSPTYCKHNEYEVGDAIPWDCSPCATQVCKTNPECCGAGATPGWSASCVIKAGNVCKDASGLWPTGKVWPRDIDTTGPTILPKYLLGPAGAVVRVDGISALGSSATVSGWACDPEWPGSAVSVRIYGGAPRDQEGTVLLGEARADLALSLPLAGEVSAACDGPGHTYDRHGFSFALPDNQQGNVYVYAIDQETADGPAAPPTLVRNGIVHVPGCAHSEHEVGAALDAGCSACAGSVCGDGTHDSCCTTTWNDVCAAAADSCSPGTGSASANSRVLAVVTTGWIEAPADGLYVFDASLQPSRLFVNGSTVLDWFDGPGTTQGSITLARGQRYYLRWDRFQGEPPPGGSGPGLTWQTPGTIGQTPIPSGSLYEIAPGSGTGLTGTYFTGTGYVGPVPVRTDPFVDVNTDVAPPSQPALDLPSGVAPPYSAIWEGELVPSFSEDYSFYVVGSGDATLTVNGAPVPLAVPGSPPAAGGGCVHNLCELGDKLTASTLGTPACNLCVDKVCAKDPYCCDGGYLSYYSTEPVWDAKCVSEVGAACGISCTNTLPSPVSPQRKSVLPVTLKSGVHYAIRLDYNNLSSDKTVRLMWSSARQQRQVIPQFALYPKAASPTETGAGLNVTYFGTKTENAKLKPDLDTAVAAGSTSDLSVTPTVGQIGTPLIDLLASPTDAARGTPPPPAVVRPRYGDQIVDSTARVVVHGIGGVTGGSVRITVDEDATVEVVAPVASDGTFDATVGLAGFGTWTLRFVQRTFTGSPCAAPALCAQSYDVTWPVTVSLTQPTGPAPVITSPRDPTNSPNPAANVFTVAGKGTASTAVTIVDEGGTTALVSPTSFVSGPDGTLSASITLTAGDVDPNKGWHKLRFVQGAASSKPVFVSVGMRPPTVEFPRSGAQLDCTKDDPELQQSHALGILSYPVQTFGPLRVYEETGRAALHQVGDQTRIIDPPNPGDPIRFDSFFALGPGKHLVYFFQAPDPPTNFTQEERDAYFRAFASTANTPKSRIEINVPPPRFPIPPGAAVVLGGRGGVFSTNLPPPSQGPLAFNVTACGPGVAQPSIFCAVPNADVNVRVGTRLYTARADDVGAWKLDVPVPVGWSDLTLAQVLDSDSGGAWSESCLSNSIGVGVRSVGGPAITVPPDITTEATSPQGAAVSYDVAGVTVDGNAVPVDCTPASGTTFPLGRTAVMCTAIDPSTGAVGLAEFAVTVIHGPPFVNVPPGGITAEATSALGALVSYDVTATDAVSGPLPVECAPSSPAQFALDADTTVSCSATNAAMQTTTATFVVRVRDTTPPDLCFLPNLTVGTNAGAGAIVSFATCAKDLVDGAVPVSCDHPSGSFFPVGKTIVSCGATDGHGNVSPSSKFTVSVGDTTPPVLKLPGTITVRATSRNGARVNYVATATDNVDPNPTVSCAPPSGAQFPLGTTTVTCKAKDASGNQSQGTFKVRVIVAWSGFLFPIPNDGSLRWPQRVPLPVLFALVDGSAGICDLPARLFVAPLDAAGNPGPEKPAPKIPPGSGNTFDFIPFVNQYLLTLDTRPLAPGAWQLRVDLGDGEVHTVRVTLVR